MKKKIVYISGAEVFDVNDVRAAFDEVRNALKLDKDTILFGVPVDEADRVGGAESEPIADTADVADADMAENDTVDESDDTMENIEDAEDESDEEFEEYDDEEPEDEEPDEESEDEEPVDIKTDDADDEIEQESQDESEQDESENESKDALVVPILSVLAAKAETVAEPVANAGEVDEVDDIDAPAAAPDDGDNDILDGIDDDMPTASEKTLEELLETMTPLREDVDAPRPKKKKSKVEQEEPIVDEIDATLENLASEFAENQDKVATNKKGSERGKIGKLKNILPFKKMKRDDSGLMGDLFGWAGIAANDDDFTTPGFFK